MLGNIDKISGAKRKENLDEPRRGRARLEGLATAIRDVDIGTIDLDHIAAREPDRSRLRETFREFELRAPLERLEEALGEGEAAAPAERAEEVVHTKSREAPIAEIGSLDGELVALAAERPRPAGEQDGQETLDVGGPPLGPMRGCLRRRRGARGRMRDPHGSDDGARRAANRATTTGRPRR